MAGVWLLIVVLVAAVLACAPGLPLIAAGPTQDPSKWPPADKELATASDTMNHLKALYEQFTREITRDGEFFLGITGERAYVAPDRRYERSEGRSAVETTVGEHVYIGSRLFKRVGNGPWEELPATMEPFVWPAKEYSFINVQNVAYEGPGEVDGRPARVLLIRHEGSVETKDAGWQYQTRLWIDPQTHYFLRRETRGTREDIDPIARRTIVHRFEGNWTYSRHNGSIAINEPPVAPAAE